MTPERARALLGLGPEVISDESLQACIDLAQEWCDRKAAAFRVSAPESAVAAITEYNVRKNLDMRGIKPSSLSMPDLSMSTDLASILNKLYEQAVQAIKDEAVARGAGFRHIRSGKVSKWQ